MHWRTYVGRKKEVMEEKREVEVSSAIVNRVLWG
jgi:hypothetical protein